MFSKWQVWSVSKLLRFDYKYSMVRLSSRLFWDCVCDDESYMKVIVCSNFVWCLCQRVCYNDISWAAQQMMRTLGQFVRLCPIWAAYYQPGLLKRDGVTVKLCLPCLSNERRDNENKSLIRRLRKTGHIKLYKKVSARMRSAISP